MTAVPCDTTRLRTTASILCARAKVAPASVSRPQCTSRASPVQMREHVPHRNVGRDARAHVLVPLSLATFHDARWHSRAVPSHLAAAAREQRGAHRWTSGRRAFAASWDLFASARASALSPPRDLRGFALRFRAMRMLLDASTLACLPAPVPVTDALCPSDYRIRTTARSQVLRCRSPQP